MRLVLGSALALALTGCANGVGVGTTFDGGDDSGCISCGDGGDVEGGNVEAGKDASPFACHPDPANFDIPGNGCDDDGDGVVDNAPPTCDVGLTQTGSAADFAKAIGLCQMADATHWGLVSATYTQGYNSTAAPDPHQHGIQTKFGANVNPRQGSALGILSTGYAEDMDSCPTNPTGQDKGLSSCRMTGAGAAPPGYPKASVVNGTKCAVSSYVNDVSALILKIKVPRNAKGFSLDFNFFSGEWPDYVCTLYNDSFVAWLTSSAFPGTNGDFNVALDGNGNPVNVNNGFFDVCSPAGLKCPTMPAASTCSLGESQLAGTGFTISGDNQCGQVDSGGGATGWLTTQAPVAPGETIVLQLIIWDTFDQLNDSSVLVDNFGWSSAIPSAGTVRPPN